MSFVTSPSLTDAQHEAVTHGDGPLLILAGPGSGKTRVITERIVHLMQGGTLADEILALTFTNKAADEMRQRVARRTNGQYVTISTFHRFCAGLLREHAPLVGLSENFTIYDRSDSVKAINEAIAEDSINLIHFTPDRIAQAISWAKNNLVTFDEYRAQPGRPLSTIVAQCYPLYQRKLLACNAVDFDDLLLHAVTLLRENPELQKKLDRRYRHILVDEYQDTNSAQYAIVRSLSIANPNLCVTGDPDQSIYGWRGANLDNILDFEKDYPHVHVVRLEQNYRSTQRILRVADDLISNNVRRKEKALHTNNPPGCPVRLLQCIDERDEAESIASTIASAVQKGRRRPSDFAIFYRVNALSRVIEQALAEHNLPYQIVNGVEFYERKEIKDILAYLRLINNPRDDVAFLRVVNNPPRGIGKKTIQRISEHARGYGRSLLEAAHDEALLACVHKRANTQLRAFAKLMDQLALRVTAQVEEIVGLLLTESGYLHQYQEDATPEAQERLSNIEELITAARQFDQRLGDESNLESFLEQAALVNDTDAWEDDTDKITLMSLHAAKGLEFPVIFIVAVEHGLIPHSRSVDEPEQLEEERRLLFVGITRARNELQLCCTKKRAFRGQLKRTIPSNFLMELPRAEMDVIDRTGGGYHAEPSTDVDFDPSTFDVESFDQDVSDRDPEPNRENSNLSVSLVTAADMLGRKTTDEPESFDVEQYKLGLLVKHPEYGLGRIVAIRGSGANRTATIQFFSIVERKSLVLSYSPLEIIGSPG